MEDKMKQVTVTINVENSKAPEQEAAAMLRNIANNIADEGMTSEGRAFGDGSYQFSVQ